MLDDGSTDATAAVASWEGARVVAAQDVLPETGPGSGKGNAMWKSLDAAEGDILCWLDADIRNFGAHFVTGLLGPLLTAARRRVREGLLPAAAARPARRRRPRDRADGAPADLDAVPAARALRAAALG